MKMKLRTLSLFMATCLIATALGNYSISSVASEVNGTFVNNLKTKISEDLQAVLCKVEDDDVIPVYVWINDIDYDMLERKVVQTIGFSKDMIIEKSNALYKPLTEKLTGDVMRWTAVGKGIDLTPPGSHNAIAQITKSSAFGLMRDFYLNHKTELTELLEVVDRYIDTKRIFTQEFYNEQNSSFENQYLKNAKIIFRSQYSPMIICELPKNAILHLNSLNFIESLSLYRKLESAVEGNIAVGVKNISGDYTRDRLGFDGSGVKIGQIEPGLPETGVAELNAATIIRHGSYGTSKHASVVAAIMVGNKGMAPQSNLYSTACATSESFYANAEWLISSGVNVINMSAYLRGKDAYGAPESDAVYGTVAKWVDHIVYQHGVSWVKSAGNSGADAYVTSPGNAYNVITVGGINDNGTALTGDDTYYYDTNSKTGSGMPSKPDVVAPAVGFSVTGTSTMSGTSFAAPYVTGMIAQMMSFSPTLKFRPDAIKAAVVASCDRKTSGESISQITTKEGAGVINALNAANSISNVVVQKTYYNTSAQTFSFDFYPLTTGTKTIAIAWLKRSSGTGTNHTYISGDRIVDFDLRIYDINGKLVGSSASANNSVEMVRFTATTIDKYTVEIKRFTSGTSIEKISLAHVRD